MHTKVTEYCDQLAVISERHMKEPDVRNDVPGRDRWTDVTCLYHLELDALLDVGQYL